MTCHLIINLKSAIVFPAIASEILSDQILNDLGFCKIL